MILINLHRVLSVFTLETTELMHYFRDSACNLPHNFYKSCYLRSSVLPDRYLSGDKVVFQSTDFTATQLTLEL